MHWNFKKEKPYFVLDPEGDGITYFETTEDRDKFAEECVRQYIDDTWSEEVVYVVAGVITHSAQEVDRQDRPTELDEDGLDESGEYWDSDCEYKCNFKMLPVGSGEALKD